MEKPQGKTFYEQLDLVAYLESARPEAVAVVRWCAEGKPVGHLVIIACDILLGDMRADPAFFGGAGFTVETVEWLQGHLGRNVYVHV